MAGIKQSKEKHIIFNTVSQLGNADRIGIVKKQSKDSNNNNKSSNSNNGSNNNNNNNNNDKIVKQSLTGR